jgi:hypothetical protein
MEELEKHEAMIDVINGNIKIRKKIKATISNRLKTANSAVEIRSAIVNSAESWSRPSSLNEI